jgi:hypothetical protein
LAAKGHRVAAAFDYVVSRASRKLPWLSGVKLRYCRSADAEHRRKWRQFMHSNERRMTVCVARAAETELTDRELLGMAAHELGHIVGTELEFPEHQRPNHRSGKTPTAVQREADWIARNVLGFKIRYNKRTIQEVA